MNTDRPLDGVASIRVKLGLLVGASVVVAVIVAGVGEAAEVPWWMSVPVTVAAALAVTQWLARGMTSPLREMTAAARRMAAGDYAQRVTATSSDEVGTLARAFNAMAADLATADQQRRQLVATVSHELRTPLTAQRALLENLVDGVVQPDDDALRAALTQSERLSALVGDLLDLSRIDAGAAPLALTRCGSASCSARRSPRPWSADGRCGCATRPTRPTSPWSPTPARLAQLVANLVDNAVRHSPPQGEVRVVARGVDDDTWWLEVYDDGPGIPADRVERVFDRFGSGGDSAGGTGLGLAIASWVCELHGGTIIALPTAARNDRRAPARRPAPARPRRPPHPPPGGEDRARTDDPHEPGRRRLDGPGGSTLGSRARSRPRPTHRLPPPWRPGPRAPAPGGERSTASGPRRACPRSRSPCWRHWASAPGRR